jgi:hypothetical protein
MDDEPLRGRAGQKLLEVSFHEFANPHATQFWWGGQTGIARGAVWSRSVSQ